MVLFTNNYLCWNIFQHPKSINKYVCTLSIFDWEPCLPIQLIIATSWNSDTDFAIIAPSICMQLSISSLSQFNTDIEINNLAILHPFVFSVSWLREKGNYIWTLTKHTKKNIDFVSTARLVSHLPFNFITIKRFIHIDPLLNISIHTL